MFPYSQINSHTRLFISISFHITWNQKNFLEKIEYEENLEEIFRCDRYKRGIFVQQFLVYSKIFKILWTHLLENYKAVTTKITTFLKLELIVLLTKKQNSDNWLYLCILISILFIHQAH